MAGGRGEFRIAAAAAAMVCLTFGASAEEAEIGAIFPWSAENIGGSISSESLYYDVVGNLGAVSVDKRDNHNFLRTVIISSFDTSLAISAYHLRYLDPKQDDSTNQVFIWTDDYSLEVAYSDYRADPIPVESGNHFTATTHRYFVEITKDEYDRLSKSWFESGVMEEPRYYPDRRLCADGVGYWVEAKVNDHHNLLSRHDCARRYREDFLYSEFLFDFAAEKIPELAEKLNSLKAKILEDNLQ